MNVDYKKHLLKFKFQAGTSRGVLHTKLTYIIRLTSGNAVGYGECGPLAGLSPDDTPEFEQHLNLLLKKFSENPSPETIQSIDAALFPSIRFGLETAFRDLNSEQEKLIFDTPFHSGKEAIPINGLIWMGTPDDMLRQAEKKLSEGFDCLKLKIGAISFEDELRVLAELRKHYPPHLITLRVDANGAFHPAEAMEKLKQLAEFKLHSIEQPIVPGQHEAMAHLCRHSPVPIALDEELIACTQKAELLEKLKPSYLILKPTLLGGFQTCDEWIMEAEKRGTGWWITSALESNVGLNAICQYTSFKDPSGKYLHGLGTGSLYHNNFPSPLSVNAGTIAAAGTEEWPMDILSECSN